MIISLLGTDCCGKNTIMDALCKEFNYEHFMMPRSPICHIVYDTIYNRKTEERTKNINNIIKQFLKINTYFILVESKDEILLERALARNEKHVSNIDTFRKHKQVYSYYFEYFKNIYLENYKNNFIRVDNSGSIEGVVKQIVYKLKLEN
jgi:thymidylate kinase